jgi:hypothetical protein
MASIPHMERATRRAEVYARSEVEAILTAPRQAVRSPGLAREELDENVRRSYGQFASDDHI